MCTMERLFFTGGGDGGTRMSEIVMIGRVLENDLEQDEDAVEFTGSKSGENDRYPYWLSIRTPKGTVLVFEFSKQERDKLIRSWT